MTTFNPERDIEIGKQYCFAYPIPFTTLPEYKAHAGHPVKVLSLTQEGNQDEEAIYAVQSVIDGWQGEAFESELVEL